VTAALIQTRTFEVWRNFHGSWLDSWLGCQ